LKQATIGQMLDDIARGGAPGQALVCLFATAPYVNAAAGVGLEDYYYDPAVKLAAQQKLIDRFPKAALWPGLWADFGAFGEPSAFGCRVRWPEGQGMPSAQPVITGPEDMDRLRPMDPEKDGLLPLALDHLHYMVDHADPRYLQKYGYLDGVGISFGPGELAAVLMGHENFFLSLFEQGPRLHRMLSVVTDSVIAWLRAQERVTGTLRRLALPDHLAGQLSREQFEEFDLPYLRRVIQAFPRALVLYHNEYPVPYPEALADLGAHVFHFGGELGPVRRALGGRMTLMGNLEPVELLRKAPPEEIRRRSLELLQEAAGPRGFLLSAGGGLAPDTPAAALEAMQRAVEDYQSPPS
jgi:uroporphyrinogen decarboxylase